MLPAHLLGGGEFCHDAGAKEGLDLLLPADRAAGAGREGAGSSMGWRCCATRAPAGTGDASASAKKPPGERQGGAQKPRGGRPPKLPARCLLCSARGAETKRKKGKNENEIKRAAAPPEAPPEAGEQLLRPLTAGPTSPESSAPSWWQTPAPGGGGKEGEPTGHVFRQVLSSRKGEGIVRSVAGLTRVYWPSVASSRRPVRMGHSRRGMPPAWPNLRGVGGRWVLDGAGGMICAARGRATPGPTAGAPSAPKGGRGQHPPSQINTPLPASAVAGPGRGAPQPSRAEQSRGLFEQVKSPSKASQQVTQTPVKRRSEGSPEDAGQGLIQVLLISVPIAGHVLAHLRSHRGHKAVENEGKPGWKASV